MRCLHLLIVLISTSMSSALPACAGDGLEIACKRREPLPAFEYEGKPARIHTQGLFATDRHYYVTGRLETPPKRPLLVRFQRDDTQQVEVLDLSPGTADASDGVGVDHPGGFDSDGRSFWIPVAVSRPHSSTVVVRVPHEPDRSLSELPVEAVFRVDDHLGAIAFDREAKLIFAANWDTRQILVYRTDGALVERIRREDLVAGDPGWALAVQDWKSLGNDLILAGGIDKSPQRDRRVSPSVIEVLDIPGRRRVARVHLDPPEHGRGPLTREGLARLGDTLLFLPGDLGRDAAIFHYQSEGLLK